MTTLQELVRYCNEENHLGAFLLTGEWGCGKTYLIETDLTEALRATHFIVRVSLLGVESINALNDAVRRQWLYIYAGHGLAERAERSGFKRQPVFRRRQLPAERFRVIRLCGARRR